MPHWALRVATVQVGYEFLLLGVNGYNDLPPCVAHLLIMRKGWFSRYQILGRNTLSADRKGYKVGLDGS